MASSNIEAKILMQNNITNKKIPSNHYAARSVDQSILFDSNECSSFQSSIKESKLVGSTPELKLVLKRRSYNSYEVKTARYY